MNWRSAWMIFQWVASFLIGVGMYTIYEIMDAASSKALSTWFNGGMNSLLASSGISSSMLEAVLQGQNIFGASAAIISFIIFMAASRPRKSAGGP